MLYTVPSYYKKFHCLADLCPATCCAGWQIVVDQKSLKRYASLKGSFGNRVKNSVDWKERTFLQYGKRCVFLNEENLCDMHLEAGHEMLCATCRKYPRHIEVFENEREISLSMSCPAAARLILLRKDRLTFLQAEDDKEDKEDELFDSFLYSALQDARKELFKQIQKREESVFLRMSKVLALAHDVQNRMNGNRIFEIETVLSAYQKEQVQKRLETRLIQEAEDFRNRNVEGNLLDLLDEWEVLDQNWTKDVAVWKEILKGQKGRDSFRRFWDSQKELEIKCEQMMVYYLYTYFCGAVYDKDALAKAKLSVCSTLIWLWICFAKWIQNGENLSVDEELELAWRYSRELEHSDQNLNKMDELAGRSPQLSMENLINHCMMAL